MGDEMRVPVYGLSDCWLLSNKDLYVYTLFCELFFEFLNSLFLSFPRSMLGISTCII